MPSIRQAILGLTLLLCAAPRARAAEPDSARIVSNPQKYGVVVSATKTAKDPLEVPNATQVVSGQDLRARGARTLADALQDVVGLDTGDGSDNGMRLPNLGLWGLKEFDALLVTLDGMPVGGPFNPSLAMIPIEDVDRIEIVKGPQGSLYGVSAFAGMVQVFTRDREEGDGHLTVGRGAFEDRHASAGYQRVWGGTTVRVSGATQASQGWQERTGSDVDRGTLSLSRALGAARASLDLWALYDHQGWGTPLPYEAGEVVPGFARDVNYAVLGARVDHHVWGLNQHVVWPFGGRYQVENLLGATRDDQLSVRSFPDPGAAAGDTVPSAGVLLRPEETTVFDDLRLVSHLDAGGRHELVTGAAITYGKTTADGIGFDLDQVLGRPASIPRLGDLPVGDVRSFSDQRTFAGAYAHEEFTPGRLGWLTLAGGGRFDRTHEKLHARAQEQDGVSPLEVADDARDRSAWSGDLSALVRLVPRPTRALEAVNLYGSWKSSFKPAAPNLTEAESAEILDPEWTHSLEGGLKARALDGQVALEASMFDMTFTNMVVAVLDTAGLPALTNAGQERFKGVEVGLALAPRALAGATLNLGYAHHDPRFLQFTFVTPDGQLANVGGKVIELAPREMFNAKAGYVAKCGAGAWGAVRGQGERFLNRRNTFTTDAFTEWDAGITFQRSRVRLSLAGRNLGDSRHVVGESDLGDSQYYIAPPRRVTAEVSWSL